MKMDEHPFCQFAVHQGTRLLTECQFNVYIIIYIHTYIFARFFLNADFSQVNEWFFVFFLIYRCVLGFAATWSYFILMCIYIYRVYGYNIHIHTLSIHI